MEKEMDGGRSTENWQQLCCPIETSGPTGKIEPKKEKIENKDTYALMTSVANAMNSNSN